MLFCSLLGGLLPPPFPSFIFIGGGREGGGGLGSGWFGCRFEGGLLLSLSDESLSSGDSSGELLFLV